MLINATRPQQVQKFLDALGVKERQDPAWPLPNMKESSEDAFWGWRTGYSFYAEGHALSMRDEKGQWFNLFVYYVGHSQFIDGGFAVKVVYNSHPAPRTVTYYEWRACDHEFTEKNIGNCLNQYTCSKCGKSYAVDSSD